MVTPSAPDRGDIIWIDFDPTKGHEQKGLRPAFVVSSRIYNSRAGLLLACPITSQGKGYPFEVPCKVPGVEGFVLADHIRSVDWKTRRVKHIGTAPLAVSEVVQERLLALIKS